MKEFYNTWKLEYKHAYDEYQRTNGRIQWVKLFGKKEGRLYCQRYSHTAPWLNYLDSLDQDQADKALDVMEAFCKKKALPHTVCVKKIFHQIVKPDLLLVDAYTGLSSQLDQELENAALPKPNTKNKQDHSKSMETRKKAKMANTE